MRAGREVASEWGVDVVDLPAYLERIGRPAGLPEPSAHTLRILHRAHVQSIPFENIDVPLGRPIKLDLAAIQDKLVGHRRGGICHEQNLLFAAVLERVGFAVRRQLARVRDDGLAVLPRAHSALLVEADGATWLADVGYGADGLLEPVPLIEQPTITQEAWGFQLHRRGHAWVLSSRSPEPQVLYSILDEDAYRRPDFEVASYFMSTHPDSPFSSALIAQRVTSRARYALRGLDLTVTLPNGRVATERITPWSLSEVLGRTFGIDLTTADTTRLNPGSLNPGTLNPGAEPGS